MPEAPPSIISIDALVTGAERGLVADIRAALTLGVTSFGVCTSIVIASHDQVTDVTEVPSDTVQAQLEHLSTTTSSKGLFIGTLGEHQSAEHVMNFAERFSGPVIIDFSISGPSGETVLTKRGTEVVLDNLSIPDLVSVNRRDAELITGGEIQSLDDAQVAVQRLHNRGAKRVLIRCGMLPTRFFDAHDDPGGDGSPSTFMTDLYYDGDEFALFEGPHVERARIEGASSALHMGILTGLIGDDDFEEAIQRGKRFVTEGIRHASSDGRLSFTNLVEAA